MKKVGTLSLNINTHDLNYGAILHSFAFCRLLRSKGIECEVIDYTTPIFESYNLKYPLGGYLKDGKFTNSILALLRTGSHARRYDKFESFKKNHMYISEKHYTYEELSKAKLDYSTLICESDVIWSPEFFGGVFDKSFFLAHESMKEIHRVAYSASLGNCEFTPELENEFTSLLTNLDAVSCRETYAAEFTQQHTEKDVVCVLDPVLLLKEKDYEDVTAAPMINQPYVLLYLPVKYNKKIVPAVEKYAKDRGLKLIEISRFPWECLRHKTIQDAGVEEFLSLIKNAEVVFSNSFHAVCFSVIFHKEFYAFSRRTGLKIKDICERLGLNTRFITDVVISDDQPINYSEVDMKLDKERERSFFFIENNIIK